MTSFADLCLLGAASVAVAPANAAATPVAASLEAAGARVRALLQARWGVAPERIRLQWGHALEPFANDAIELAGMGDGGWFVAIGSRAASGTTAARVRAGVEVRMPVAARALPAGTPIAEPDVAWGTRVVWGPPSAADRAPDVVGARTRRPVAAGARLDAVALERPALIANGEPVALEWRRGAVRVALEGTALGAANAGERVRVRLSGRDGERTGIARERGAATLESGARP